MGGAGPEVMVNADIPGDIIQWIRTTEDHPLVHW